MCGHEDSKWQLNLKGVFFIGFFPTTYVQETELNHKEISSITCPYCLALVLFPKLSCLPKSLGFVAIYILAEVNLSSMFCVSYSEFRVVTRLEIH